MIAAINFYKKVDKLEKKLIETESIIVSLIYKINSLKNRDLIFP